MAVQAGLLNAQIPMSARNDPPDVVGSYVKGYNMRGEMAASDQKVAAVKREFDDRAAVDSYLKSGGDLSTPDGADRALKDLKGHTSPDYYSKLVAHAGQIKEGDLKLRSDMTKLSSEELGVRSKQLEQTLTFLVQPVQAYEAAVKTKGEQQAGVEFQQARDKVLQSAAQVMGPDGKPLYPPEILSQLAQADPAHLKALVASTTYMKNLTDQRFKDSQIKRNEALASWDNARASGDVATGGGSAIAKLEQDFKAGRVSEEEYNSMKSGLVAKTAKPAEQSTLTLEAVKQAATDNYLTGNLPARLSPQERSRILNESANIAKDNGDTNEEATIRKSANKATTLALNDLNKRRGLVASFERDADKRLGLILELSKKADQTGIPALNRWLNAGRTNIQGDVDVNNLNSAMISAQAELAKVLSGALGNAGVSDAARQEAGVIINKNMSPEQIESLIPNIRREMKFKLDSFDEEIGSLKGSLQTPNTQRKDSADSAAKVDPATQAERDKESAGLIMKEYKAAKAALTKFDPKESATADARNRKQQEVDAIRRELIRFGVKDPDKEEAAAPAKGLPTGWSVKVK